MDSRTIILIRFRRLIEPSLSEIMSDSGIAEREWGWKLAGRKGWEKQAHSLPQSIKKKFLDSLVPKLWKYWSAAVGAYVFFFKAPLENPHFEALHPETLYRLKLIKQEGFTRQGICLQHKCLPPRRSWLDLYCQKTNIGTPRMRFISS